jgi:hypothetical protein
MKQILTSVFLSSICALTSLAICPDAVIPCPQPEKTACCVDAYRDPYRIAYPRLMPVAEQVEITNTERAMAMRRAAVVRMRDAVRFEKELLAATTPLTQPAQSGVVVFGSTEGAGVYDSDCAVIPPAPPYPGPAQVVRLVPVGSEPLSRKGRPIATPVAGRPGYVYSPFTGKPCIVDVQGLAPGCLAKDPFTGGHFRVP